MSKLSDKLAASVRKAQSDTGNARVAVSAPPVSPPRRKSSKAAPSAAPNPVAEPANAPAPSPAAAVTAAPRPFGFPDRVWPD